jgi:two-component system response regulator ResD
MEKVEKRILVVDDDDAIRALLMTILRRRGFSVDDARNGAEAVERLERGHYAVMLLDLMMPVMNGWEVLQHLERREPARRPIAIVLTAGNEPRDLKPELVAGTVRKPFDVELLVDSVVACIAALEARDKRPDSAEEARESKRAN